MATTRRRFLKSAIATATAPLFVPGALLGLNGAVPPSERIVMAGPTLDEDAESPTGSLLVMEFDSLADAESFAAGDPYKKADLFDSVTIKPYRKVLPLA